MTERPRYTQTQRWVEVCALLGWAYAQLLIWIEISPQLRTQWLTVAGAGLLAVLSADLASGLFHWAGDTWGTPEWPILGNAFIRTFREHHDDQTAITRHDFVETNGAGALTSLWMPILALWVGRGHLFWLAYLGLLSFFTTFTGQIHKWAHQKRAPLAVRWLQRARIILTPDHHQLHHGAPFMKAYCITLGWLNRPLDAIGFFRGLERTITWLTGAPPRAYEQVLPVPLPVTTPTPEPAKARTGP